MRPALISMKQISLLVIMLINSISALKSDISDDIAHAIRSGSAAQIAHYFASSVDLKILNQENIYSKAQAELILKDFFAKHPPQKFTIAHKSTLKNDSQFAIGTLETGNGKFRLNFVMKTNGVTSILTQFRVEPEDE
jgi:hypothetical protein